MFQQTGIACCLECWKQESFCNAAGTSLSCFHLHICLTGTVSSFHATRVQQRDVLGVCRAAILWILRPLLCERDSSATLSIFSHIILSWFMLPKRKRWGVCPSDITHLVFDDSQSQTHYSHNRLLSDLAQRWTTSCFKPFIAKMDALLLHSVLD